MNSNSLTLNLNGVWQNNPALVQLLGLCPLLAVSNSAINALALGIATLFTLLLTNTLVSVTRQWLISEIRIPVYVLLIAGVVTCVSMLMNAFAHSIYLRLGIFIPLIITNCMILARAEAWASRRPVANAAFDALTHGIGFALVLIVMGSVRELLGSGTLFADSHMLLGGIVGPEPLIELSIDRGLLIAILPPGAFLLLGVLIAAKNALVQSTLLNSVKPAEDS